MNVGVIGASGYIGETLVRLLLRHPKVDLVAVTSRQHAGKPLESVIPAVRGLAHGLAFDQSDAGALAERPDVDLFFLALPHGAAAIFARTLIDAGKRVIDVSADFRISDPKVYADYYGNTHPDPDLLKKSAYVVPELEDMGWVSQSLIAVPGCYPTGMLVPLVPLLRDGLIEAEGIVVNSVSGISGAGRKLAEDYLFCERAESVKAYGLVKHRHLAEIEEQLGRAHGGPVIIQFTPHLAPMRRGIATTIVTRLTSGTAIDDVYATWGKVFEDRVFVQLLESGTTPDTKDVTGTNRIDVSAVHDPRTGNLVITSAEDNLLKGAGGQAVQIMNIWLGLPETEGLLF
ncbi:MAG: N-acetyl-gamma-glutamyl-phosphate reductase [Verrucomicrobia bacterium]|nr:MAG: N-acetyl-gamma-glutamyl-phosphate reductase [Verrucomicrobiota bacterium]